MADSSQVTDSGNIQSDVYILTENNCDLVKEIKEDMTAEEIKAESPVLEHPLNWTDPIVWHDPTIDTGVIVTFYSKDVDEDSASDAEGAHINVDGVYYPLIKINQHLVTIDEIIYVKMESRGILPTLHLQIRDRHGIITKTNASGMNNSVIIVITAPINGVYKKIKLQYYITKVIPQQEGEDIRLIINCVLKIPELTHKFPTSMNYPDKFQFPGCTKCKQEKQKQPNSWEMLHYIANHCKLGFASTNKCKEISDRCYRLFNSYDSLEQCLYKEKEFAGSNEEEAIFDWWVDFHNYLVMVNVPYIMKEDINIKHLGMYAIVSPKATTDGQKNQEPVAKLVNRTLTNSSNVGTTGSNHNLLIREYKIETNNDLYDAGTCSTNNVFMPRGAGGENGVDIFDVQTQEASVSGREMEKYTTKQTYLRGVDMSGFGKHRKGTVFAKYFQKKRAKILVIEMDQCNLGLQRGTLVNVVITENDPKIKGIMMNNLENVYDDVVQQKQERDDTSTTHPDITTTGSEGAELPNNEDRVMNQSVEEINISISGLYYIDGITFEFDESKEQRIYQKLYLIKKGEWGTFLSANAPIHINKNI